MSNPEDIVDRIHQAVERTRDSPLTAVDPDAITRAFKADPTTLTDHDLDLLAVELRRRRSAYLAQEAAKSLSKQPKTKTEAPTVAEQALLDKPPSELTAADLDD